MKIDFGRKLVEQKEATTTIERNSESSDVLFIIARAHNEGFNIPLPTNQPTRAWYYIYMILKKTSHWGFYRIAAWLAGASHGSDVREVINPLRNFKLDQVACRHDIDPAIFRRVAFVYVVYGPCPPCPRACCHSADRRK